MRFIPANLSNYIAKNVSEEIVKIKLISSISSASFFILFFIGVGLSFGQTHKIQIGVERLRLYTCSIFTDRQNLLQFPQEYEIYQLKSREFSPLCVKGGGIVLAAKNFQAKAYYRDNVPAPDRWTVADSFFTHYVVDATAWYTEDPLHSTVPVAPGAKRFWKQRPPDRIVKGINLSTGDWLNGKDFLGSDDTPTTQMGVAMANTAMGITITLRDYVFDLVDFAISEYVFKYTGHTGSYDGLGNEITYSQPIQDYYLGIKFRPIIANQDVVENSSGWKEGTDDWVDFTREEDGTLLRVIYGWDGDAGANYQAEDDEGDPLYFTSGLFAASQYPGMAVLHVDQAPNDPSDDLTQPHRFHVSYGGNVATNVLTVGRNLSRTDVYQILDQGPDSPSPFDWTGWKDAGYPGEEGQFWSYNSPHATDEGRFNQMGTLGFGPYQFNNIGDSIRVVLCYAVGMLDWESNIDLASRWKSHSIDKGEKNRILRSGRDSLFTKIKWIKDLFDSKFVSNGGNLNRTLSEMSADIGIPPAWPESVSLDPVVGGCRVEWMPVSNAVGYRVYRRARIDFDPNEPRLEPAYSLVYQCGGINPGEGIEYSPQVDSTVWVDQNVYPVFQYWYAVTSFNEQGIESSHFITRTNPLPSDNTYGSVSPFGLEYFDLDEVHVIPNPYHVKSLRLYDWPENVLAFVNLPANCRIRIFSQNGTLIFSDYHHSESALPASRYDWNMRTSNDQTIASGIYIYVIDQCRQHQGQEINKSKVGKFSVIR
jgi:hypothetical protein